MAKQKRRRCTQQPGTESASTLPTPNPRRSPAEPVNNGFLRLSDDLVEEIFLRLPPDEPACLVCASVVRKSWRRILADEGFRRRYREFHGTPPVLGLFQEDTSFVPTADLLPAFHNYRPRWGGAAVDCRHGRALFTPKNWSFDDFFDDRELFYLTVFNTLTGHHPRLLSPDYRVLRFSAAVLCGAQGCDHTGCQRGPFRVAMVTTDQAQRVTKGWLYSSENRAWNKLTSVHHPNVTKYTLNKHVPSVLVGDALYFNIDGVIKCDLGTRCLSMFERPTNAKGRLMTAEDGGLGFAAVVDFKNLTLWSTATGPEVAMGWKKLRVIDLETFLPDGALWIPKHGYGISGIAEGTQVIFVNDACGCYMVDLKSGRARKAYRRYGEKIFPYVKFYILAMEAASTDQGQ